MTDLVLLQEKMDETGMPFATIAARTGIKRETLYNRFKGIGDFTATEIVALTKVLGLKKSEREAIFFTSKVEFNATEEVI